LAAAHAHLTLKSSYALPCLSAPRLMSLSLPENVCTARRPLAWGLPSSSLTSMKVFFTWTDELRRSEAVAWCSASCSPASSKVHKLFPEAFLLPPLRKPKVPAGGVSWWRLIDAGMAFKGLEVPHGGDIRPPKPKTSDIGSVSGTTVMCSSKPPVLPSPPKEAIDSAEAVRANWAKLQAQVEERGTCDIFGASESSKS